MKKRLMVISLVLAVAMIFGGCDCQSKNTLSFIGNYKGTQMPLVGYKEVTEYAVNYSSDYKVDSYNFSKSSALNDVVDFSFSDGKFISTLEVLDRGGVTKNAQSDVLDELLNDNHVLHLVNEFSIKVTYSPKNKETETYEDFVKSEAFFLDVNNSLAPVYSYTENKSTSITVTNGSAVIGKQHFVNEIFYTKSDYTIISKTFDYDKDVSADDYILKTENKYNYNFKTIVDNAYMLFAIRNISQSQNNAYPLPVIVGAYKTAQNLAVTMDETSVEKTVGGTEYNTNRVRFAKNDATTRGMFQLTFFQNDNVDGQNKALMIKYVTPLSEYSQSYALMGALIYTLNSVTYTY